jgi:hypothetical protein
MRLTFARGRCERRGERTRPNQLLLSYTDDEERIPWGEWWGLCSIMAGPHISHGMMNANTHLFLSSTWLPLHYLCSIIRQGDLGFTSLCVVYGMWVSNKNQNDETSEMAGHHHLLLAFKCSNDGSHHYSSKKNSTRLAGGSDHYI